MFADRARLSEIAGLVGARLDEIPFSVFLLAHHEAATSGVIVARRGRLEKRVLLASGSPVDCRSNLVHETFSRYLVAQGRLKPEQETPLLSRSAASGVRFGQVLLEAGLVDEPELLRLLQQNLAKKLLDLFTWRDGALTIERGEAVPSELRVRVPQLVLTGITRFLPREGLERAIAPLAGRALARGAGLTSEREALRLGERERGLLAQLDRPRQFEELLVCGVGKPADVARSLLALALLGGIEAVPEAEESGSQAAPPAARSEGAVASPETRRGEPEESTATRTPGLADRQAIDEAFESLRQQDPFELLGLDDRATPRRIELAYLEHCRRFAPWPWSERGETAIAERAAELLLAGALAFARLADDASRAELLRVRSDLTARTARTARSRQESAAAPAPPAHSLRIETDLLDADLQFRKGLALKQAGKLDLALQQLDFAADCDPQNGLYLAEAAHCRFLLAPSTAAPRALEELGDAQRIDPKCGEAFLHAGEIAAHLGRLEEAEEALRQAARRFGPADRRALDALRDVAQRGRKKR